MTGAGLLLVLALDRGYEGAIEAAALAPAFSALIALIYMWRLPASGLHLQRLKAALRFALPFLPHFIAGWLLSASDLWILRRAGFDLELGSYSLAAQVVAPVSMVITAWNLHMSAEMGERFRAGGIPEMRSRLPRVRLTYFASAVIPAVALLLGLPLVTWVVGERFESAIIFVPFLLLAILPNTLYFSDFQILYYSGRSWWIAGATVAAAALTVSVGLLMIPRYGAYGAVSARLTGALVRSLVVVHIAGKTRGRQEELEESV
jgi:O-antigen/teichoic acid export membrane protein